MQFDSTLNFTDCLGQIANPATNGHSIDNYWLRSTNIAKFFAAAIDTTGNCNLGLNSVPPVVYQIQIVPNPNQGQFKIEGIHQDKILGLAVYNTYGQKVKSQFSFGQVHLTDQIAAGIYIIQVKTDQGTYYQRFQIH